MSGDRAIGVGTLLNGRYRLEAPLGDGGFGRVYAAMDESLGRKVAVKVLTLRAEWSPEERAERQGRFRREAYAAAALAHPNVATVHDAGAHQGSPFLVMELLAGEDFGRVLLERGGLPVTEVLSYGAQIAAGLQHAHEHGLVHRDIKPENLMLLPDGTVKVCDFGLAAQQDPTRTRHTAAHAVLGSPPYLSPEQAQGHEVTSASDLYALGCVLYAMLAEGPPFSAGTPVGYAYKHVHVAPEPIARRRPDVPAPLADLVHALLAKSPADRPGSAGEVAERLREMARPAEEARVDARHVLWALLEEGEELLAKQRYTEADRRYWEVLHRLALLGVEGDAAAFAARFGRARALEGMHGTVAAIRRFAEVARESSAALGAGHPLARCLASYAAVRAAPEQ
ncbi:serine/threonine-protein kinase [Actinacidiphila guanduensis]|uniref:non-specific serine/threonine protein kinase n=1 Tax=Actinacidiphila guanduensis TaxID=310781 RepID=A0A1H0M278_9ACTN|nr:serine/threonine-protein kinase [Actinacidiphila guanduensis]SDO74558.1 Serine/threonine protein kinase [Actinacidiphila guanduensis]